MNENFKIIPTNGIEINALVEGEGDPVIFVHGWPESWYSWRHQIKPFTETGYKVIIPDVRGYGKSSKPYNINSYTMKELTADIIGLLDYLDEPEPHIVGHDWGAPIAWYTSLLYPERILSVSGLSVPFTSSNENKPTDFFKSIYKNNFFYMLYFQKEGIAEKEFEKDLRSTLEILFTNSDYRGMKENIENPTSKSKESSFLEGLSKKESLPSWLTDKDLEYYLSQFNISGMRGPLNRYRCMDIDWAELKEISKNKIQKPACFITGELDPVNFFIRDVNLLDIIEVYYDDLRVKKIVEKCGHWTQQEKPEEVNKILLDFLKEI